MIEELLNATIFLSLTFLGGGILHAIASELYLRLEGNPFKKKG